MGNSDVEDDIERSGAVNEFNNSIIVHESLANKNKK